jgi:hypothetical protein
MSSAAVGLLGVLVGLAVGNFYAFWSTRRTELFEATAAASAIRDELWLAYGDGPWTGKSEAVERAWQESRKWLDLHLYPADYKALREMIIGPAAETVDQRIVQQKLEGLHDIYWNEHEMFIVRALLRQPLNRLGRDGHRILVRESTTAAARASSG